jgi:hypothetical protein
MSKDSVKEKDVMALCDNTLYSSMRMNSILLISFDRLIDRCIQFVVKIRLLKIMSTILNLFLNEICIITCKMTYNVTLPLKC